MTQTASLAIRSNSRDNYNFGKALLLEAEALRKRDRTRAELFNAGCSLLKHNSLSSLKITDVCREAGVAHGTFYIYFPNRLEFVANLLLRFIDYLQIVMLQVSQSGSPNKIRATTDAYYQLFAQNTGLMKCLLNHLDEFPGTLAAFQKLNREWATTIVAAAEREQSQAKGTQKIPRDELFRRAHALGGMVDQYLSALLLNRDQSLIDISSDKEAVIDTLSLIWERGMTA